MTPYVFRVPGVRGGFAVLGVSAFVFACSSPPRSAATADETRAVPLAAAPTVTAEELTMTRGHVALGEIMLEQNGNPGLQLLSNGVVQLPAEGRVVGRLSGDGRFSNPRGELLARLTDDGEVVLPDDDYLPVTISKDGALKLLKEGRTLQLRDDGSVEGTSAGAPVVTIRGVTPDTRRTALFLLVLASYPIRPRH